MNRDQLVKILDGHTKTLQDSNQAADAILAALVGELRDSTLAESRIVDFKIDGDADFTPDGAADQVEFDGGGLRDSQGEKPRFDLLFPLRVPYDEQFLTRCAVHAARSLRKYPERNWEEFSDVAALDHCRASAMRHLTQWLTGVEDGEDHAAGVFWNLMMAEYVHGRLEGKFDD